MHNIDNEKYQSLINNLNEAVIIIVNERIVFANKKATELVNYTLDELKSKQFTDFIHPSDRSLVFERYVRRLKGENVPNIYDFRVITKKGETKFVRINASKSTYEGKDASINLLTDVTKEKEVELKKAEYEKGIRIITDLATRLIESLDEKEIYTLIGDKLSELTDNSIIAVLSYDKLNNKLRIERLSGINAEVQSVLRLFDLNKMSKRGIKLTGNTKKRLLKNELIRIKGGLYEASLKQMPKSAAEASEKLLNIKNIHATGLQRKGLLYGICIIISREQKKPNDELIKTFANTTSIALYKKELIEKLSYSEEKCRTIFDSAADEMFLLNYNGQIIDANKAAYKELGYMPDELKNLNLSVINTKEYSKKTRKMLDEIIKNGELTFNTTHVTKDKKEIPIESHAKLIRFNSTNAILNIARNVSVRKKIEEELVNSEAKYHNLIENVNDIIHSIDTRGVITYISNNVSKYGFKPEQLIGQEITKIVYPDDIKKVINDLKKTLQTGIEFPTVFRVQKNNNTYWFEEYGKPIRNSKGIITGIQGVLRDITERVRAEEELKIMQKIKAEADAKQELDKLRSDFLARVSHELKQSIMPLIGYARILEKEIDRKDHLDYLGMIIQSSYEMNDSISKLLNLMKLEKGELGFKFANMDLSKLVKEVLNYKSASIKLKNLAVNTQIKKVKIKGDYERLKEVVINVLDNAIKFSKEHGLIEVKMSAKLNKAYISIKDYGIGIRKEELPGLFSTFYQTKEGIKVGGFGVGLSLARNIILKHKGDIKVKSEYGKSTEFIIIIPKKII